MDHNRLTESWYGIQGNNRFLRRAVGALLVIEALTLAGWFSKNQTVILVPPSLDERAEIRRNRASESYKKAWAVHAAVLLGNVSSGNADFVLKSMIDMSAGEAQDLIREQVARDLQSLREEQAASVFQVRSALYEPETDKVFVTGKTHLAGPSGKTKESEETFEFRIDMRGYAPVITEFTVYPGPPRTEGVLLREQRKEEHQNQQAKGAHP
ncbi:type IV conjugative transfer system protein TraE [Methylococcus capsulatus]|uniref:type IV conjugative transfer system protein TraE n=1 Tax=Methylococcus capsulatus TaxID=414 RepID=UPI001C52F10C|nr:type IV conjugative transfer system protein TraE [Methylococcus capsulatus]QXP89488.1 type IV conjugative transfer system protein TraE [Methylococcus capsulatus]